jgi:hypothetical protein
LGFAVFGGRLLFFRRVWWFSVDPEVLCGLGVVVVSCSPEWQWWPEFMVMRWWSTGEICFLSCFGFDVVAVCKDLRVRVGWLAVVDDFLHFVLVSGFGWVLILVRVDSVGKI